MLQTKPQSSSPDGTLKTEPAGLYCCCQKRASAHSGFTLFTSNDVPEHFEDFPGLSVVQTYVGFTYSICSNAAPWISSDCWASVCVVIFLLTKWEKWGFGVLTWNIFVTTSSSLFWSSLHWSNRGILLSPNSPLWGGDRFSLCVHVWWVMLSLHKFRFPLTLTQDVTLFIVTPPFPRQMETGQRAIDNTVKNLLVVNCIFCLDCAPLSHTLLCGWLYYLTRATCLCTICSWWRQQTIMELLNVNLSWLIFVISSKQLF